MAGKAQILVACGLVELFTEVKKPHYMKAGMPTYAGSKRARSLESELKNGRAAMLAIASFEAGHWVPQDL